MLTPKQNLIECITGGTPDRYVQQFEAFTPLVFTNPYGMPQMIDEHTFRDEWGLYYKLIDNQPGLFPMHDPEHLVCPDITEWNDVVKRPADVDKDELWEPILAQVEQVDRENKLLTAFVAPGFFERLHHLHGITDTFADLYEEPEAIKDAIAMIFDWDMHLAEQICTRVKPEALFRHDDWGSNNSTFMSNEMFQEFLYEPTKQLYDYYKDHGVKVIVHHSDSYGETLVPLMIDMGIDIWQGVLRETNDIAKLIETYGGKISFMGGIESKIIDRPGWSEEEVKEEVNRAFDAVNSKNFFIPCLTAGACDSDYPGVYDAVNAAIRERSAIDFA